MLAYAAVLAEFERARAEVRGVVLDQVFAQLSADPFEWEGASGNRIFVLWRAPDGQLHVATVTLRHLLKCAAGHTQVR